MLQNRNKILIGKIELTIYEDPSGEDIIQCARLKPQSEPRITLGQKYEDVLESLKRDDFGKIFVYKNGDEIVGFSIIVLTGAVRGYIRNIAVSPDWRNKGIGTAIMEYLEKLIYFLSPKVIDLKWENTYSLQVRQAELERLRQVCWLAKAFTFL